MYRRYLSGYVIASLIMLGLVFRPTTATIAAPSIQGLHVSGNMIVNSANQPIRLLGVNRSGTEFMCVQNHGIFDGPSDAASVQAMAAWHINAVRVPLNEDCWLAINGINAAYSGTTYQQAIVNYVNLLNSNGLIAILDLHWNAPGATQATGQNPMPDSDHSPAFWQSVANTFKNNNSVIFDLFNEPYPDNNSDTTAGWACWKNGGSCSGVSYQVAGMQALVTTVRNTGATNIIMLGGLQYSNALSQWLTYKPSDSTGNLVAAWHSYNFNICSNASCWNNTLAPVLAQVPVVAGEIGENDCAHGYIDSLMSWLDTHNTGYLGWTWNTWDCRSGPALIGDYNGTATAFGQGLKDHLAALAATSPTPTAAPSATATRTPSATATRSPTPTGSQTATATRTSTPTPTATSGASCLVTYSITNQWNTGFQGDVSIKNTGSAAINGWTLAWAFPNGQTITQLWNGTVTQAGANVSVTNLSWNAGIAAGGTVNVGFLANKSSTNAKPLAFMLNGASCSVSP